jgi:hypothetical protein
MHAGLKKILLVLSLLTIFQFGYGQKGNNLLKKYEIGLLQLLLADSTSHANFNVTNDFNFGLDNELFTNSTIIKKGKQVYIQPQGTGRVYQAIQSNGQIQVNRIDKTIHSGVNFFAQNFFIKDTLFQYGGLGFWQIRGILTYFSPQTKQWELIQTNRAVPAYFNNLRDIVMHYSDASSAPKLYVSNSYYYPNYPSSFESVPVDSCYEFNFHNRKWRTLGKLNPAFKKIAENKHARTIEIHHKDLVIYESQLEFYWVNFEKNQAGQVNTKESDQLRQAWLAFYNNNKTKKEVQFQFNLNDVLYFAKINEQNDLEWSTIKLHFEETAKDGIIPVYLTNDGILNRVLSLFKTYTSQVYLSILGIILAGFLGVKFFRKKRMPKEVVTILYQNFFSSLSIIEKELLEALLRNNLKGEELSTKNINKIIGVQQKDTLTQNKSRSDHFIKMNQKFKMATQQTEPLIIKNRDKGDKRQFNYDLNGIYTSEVEKLFKS